MNTLCRIGSVNQFNYQFPVGNASRRGQAKKCERQTTHCNLLTIGHQPQRTVDYLINQFTVEFAMFRIGWAKRQFEREITHRFISVDREKVRPADAPSYFFFSITLEPRFE